jgi:hypothetical protein
MKVKMKFMLVLMDLERALNNETLEGNERF